MKRRIWQIAWDMWGHRNNHLHDQLNSIHPQENININNKIRHKVEYGLGLMPQSYSGMFLGPLDNKLKISRRLKVEWLFTVWSARETHDIAYMASNTNFNTNASLRFKYTRWKQRIYI